LILLHDVRHSLKLLVRSPGFTVAAVLSLALGIGANTAIFTVVDRILLKSLQVSDPHELVFVTDQRARQEPSPRFSYPFYVVLKDNAVLKGTAARYSMFMNATMDGQVARIRGELVSGNYFRVIGAGTQIGRPLAPEDDQAPGSHPVAVISEGFWHRTFGADRSVVGRSIQINNYTFTIIGVAAARFTGTDVGLPTDIWIPMMMQGQVGRELLEDAETYWLEIIGRLPAGVSRERAGAELTVYMERRLPRRTGDFADTEGQAVNRDLSRGRLVLLPGEKGDSPVRRELGPALTLLLVLSGLALALACINVANLLVVRSLSREKEIAVRLVLGARPSDLIQQTLTETFLLAALGGTAALVIAPWAAGLLVRSQPDRLGIDPSLDMRVFMFGMAASVLTALFVGLAPILASRKIALAQPSVSYSAATSITPRRMTVHGVILTFQTAVALTILVGAALLVQSLQRLESVDTGFESDDLLLVSVDPGSAGYDEHQLEVFWRATLDRLSQLRGVESVSLAGTALLQADRQRWPVLDPASGEILEIDTNFIGPSYFRTLATPLVGGREFDRRDGKTSALVAIVNERLARMISPHEDAVGRGIRIAGGPVREIVGVVKNVKYRNLRDDAPPVLYVPLFQTTTTDPMTLHVRAASDPLILSETIRREIAALDADLPLYNLTTLDDLMDASFAQTRQAAVLTSGFGLLTLLLSGIGIYGVTALAVSRHRRDIGVRMALGAEHYHIMRVFGRRGVTVAIAGLCLGLLGSLWFRRIADALLFGVAPASESVTFAGMAMVLAVVSLLAVYIPARSATHLDPVDAIRYE
jgi:predicted permease